MASEITYAEVKFKDKSKSSGTDSDPPAGPKKKTIPHENNPSLPRLLLFLLLILFMLLAILFFVAFVIFFKKYSQLFEEKRIIKELNHTELECIKNRSTMEGKVWSCCPKNWKSFSTRCYFISTDAKSWQQSAERCSRMQAHLLVINTKEEQNFIAQNLMTRAAYYVGLSDPKGQRHWQWVDQTPYNGSSTFWHPGEPNNKNERCVMLNHLTNKRPWGWNDVNCDSLQRSVCEMMTISL